MAKIELPKPAREAIVRTLSKYLKDELDVEVSGFDAEFLLDHIVATVGPHLYNQGLADAQALLATRAEQLVEAIGELEKPVKG